MPGRVGPLVLLHAGRSVSPESPGDGDPGTKKRPASVWGGGAPGCSSAAIRRRALCPQRTPSRELPCVLPVPPPIAAADDRRAAESMIPFRIAPQRNRRGVRTAATAEAHGSRRRRDRDRRGARLRRDPERQRRGGEHGRRRGHPGRGGGGEGGHRSVLSFVVGRSVSIRLRAPPMVGGVEPGANAKTGGASDRPIPEAIPSCRPARRLVLR